MSAHDLPISALLERLRVHSGNGETEPIRNLLKDSRLSLVATLIIHAHAEQWGEVHRLLFDYDGERDALTLDSPLSASGISVRVVNTLEEAGLLTFRDVSNISLDAIRRVPNLGNEAVEEVRHWLAVANTNTAKAARAGHATSGNVARNDEIRRDRMASEQPTTGAKRLGRPPKSSYGIR